MPEERRAEERRRTEERPENKGSMTVAEAGHRGGTKTAETHTHEFYEEIGHKGGEIGGQRVRELIQEGKKVEQEEGKAPETERSRSRSSERGTEEESRR